MKWIRAYFVTDDTAVRVCEKSDAVTYTPISKVINRVRDSWS